MTDPYNAPNVRSPGTPVCHPNDVSIPMSPEAGESFAIAEAMRRTDESDYIELHASSAFSFLEGASEPESLVERAAELGMPAMGLSDRNGIYGVARFHTAAHRHGVRAHIGAEIAVSFWGNSLAPPSWLPHKYEPYPSRIVLLCASQTGYQNLCQLITRFKMRESTKAEGAATLEDLEEFSDGLICLTGGEEGPLAAALARGGRDEALNVVDRLGSIYGRGNVFVELQRHQLREQESRNQAVLRIASALNLPVIATNGVRYSTQKDRELFDVFTAIRHGKTLDSAGRLLDVNSMRYLRNARQMSTLFHDIPEAVTNTRIVSDRLEFTLDKLGYEFPHYPVPDGETMDSFLSKRVEEGVRKRYGSPAKRHLLNNARAQVRHELALIAKLGFAGYFLIVWDIIRYCQQHGILVQGRGSAANSAVCYALEITAVDPVGMELLFERFLSENRGEWPDIDLDLPSGEQREQVIQHIYEQYGSLGTAMTANVITYGGRMASREVGKALGFDEDTSSRLSGLVGNWEWRGENDTMTSYFKQAGFDIRHKRIARYIDLCERMQDLPRHLGQHSGGMVICAGLLNRIVPIERASMPCRTVVQWDKEDCAGLGIIKVDLLGLGMMAVLKDCIELIPRHYGKEIDLAQLPQEDEVYSIIQQADTVGMFQIESRAQMASLPLTHPECFYHIVINVAIIRPGPVVGGMVHPYMRRRQGEEEITYPHPSLEPVLKRTLGVPLFQEQLLRIAMTVADFSGAEAEELRRAVGMRRSMQRMKDLEGRLRFGMTRNGITGEVQDKIVQGIASFALYGFPESHAASFALIAYASAYLKINYLAAFTCALLNNQPMGFYSPAVLVKDAQRHGLRVRPINAQYSEWLCSLEKESNGSLSLRIGLSYVKGLRESSAEALLNARARDSAFQSVDHLIARVPGLNREELTTLAHIGALNSLEDVEHRRDALWQVEEACRPVGPLLRGPIATTSRKKTPLRKMNTEERLTADFAGLGLTTGPHVMTYYRTTLRKNGVVSAKELSQMHPGLWVRVAGGVIARQRPGTAKGFVFLLLEDETGHVSVIFTPDIFERDRLTVTGYRFLLIEGPLQIEKKVIHVKARRILPLDISKVQISSHNFH
jgi:error-prone DNA polymerase